MSHFLKLSLILLLLVFLSVGCVAEKMINQIPERQGTKAYLKKDYTTAIAKYGEASRNDNADAKYALATMYMEGKGVDKDMAKTLQLLEQACAQEQKDALLLLGLFYVYGDNVPTDAARGASLIYRAGVAKNDVAMYYMGHLYAAGVGVEKDLRRARMWMNNAKEFGFPVKKELLTLKGLEALYAD
nr:tetratricopeptide repeat protein [uncultured Pseudodesulfovibrio sp.]